MNKPKVAVLISGRGSNLLSLIKNAENYCISDIISNNKEAKGLDFGKEYSISTNVFDRKDFSSLKEQKLAIFNHVKTSKPDLVVLAGFMQIIPDYFINEFYGKLINIHPSLLPKYPGLDTHKRAIENNEEKHGCTVHFVDNGVDTGPIIAQCACDISENETEDSLSAKLLPFEHRIFPWVINNLASNNINLNERTVTFTDQAINEAENENFILGKN